MHIRYGIAQCSIAVLLFVIVLHIFLIILQFNLLMVMSIKIPVNTWRLHFIKVQILKMSGRKIERLWWDKLLNNLLVVA